MDRKLTHLGFIQDVVNRLSTNSFLLKGWSVVIVSALFALSANDSNPKFVFLAYIPCVAFWGLDGYFLGLERVYRRHYERIRTKTPDEIDFSMDASDLQEGFKEWAVATGSKTVAWFHGAVFVSIVAVMVIQMKGG